MPGIASGFAAMMAAKKAKKTGPAKPVKGKKPMPPMKKKGGKIEKPDAGPLSALY